MTPGERIAAAISLGTPDRVPVVPDFDIYIAAHAGISMHELLFDMEKAEAALDAVHADFDIDGNHLFLGGCGPYIALGIPARWRLPGRDGAPDEPMQMREEELDGPEIYQWIARKGGARYYLRNVLRANPVMRGIHAPAYAGGFAGYTLRARRHFKKWERRGIPCLGGAVPGILPFDALSGARSFPEFAKDLHRAPDEVLAAARAMEPFSVFFIVSVARTLGLRYCFIGSARSSASFVSPRVFERFYLPSLVTATREMVSRGLVPFLHFDSDYTAMLEHFKELPRGACVLNLDESTDIFKAKEVLGDHMCLMGNVPAALLKLGRPDEVDSYCRRLIEEVGVGGGFILSSSCSVPPDARPDNVRAMVESVKRYGPPG